MIYAVYNEKGGVGKSTAATYLGLAMAEAGKRVLVVGLDPQKNAASYMGVPEGQGIGEIMVALVNDLPHNIEPANVWRSLDLLQAGGIIRGLKNAEKPDTLSQALDPYREVYETIFLDLPPTIGDMTPQAFTAADEVIVVVDSNFSGAKAVVNVEKLIAAAQGSTNIFAGWILQARSEHRGMTTKIATTLGKRYESRFLEPIPKRIVVDELQAKGQHLFEVNPEHIVAQTYRRNATRIMESVDV